MDAAIQRPGTDSGVSNATSFRIHGTTASIPRQRLGKQLLSLPRMLTKVIPVTTRITEENLPFDKVSYIRYGRIGFTEHSDSQKFSYEEQLVRKARASRPVTNSQSDSCQHSRQKTSQDRSEARYRRARTQCN
jgi:hypothetical protein